MRVPARKKSRQHPDFPGGHPPEYYPSLRLLNFAERTGYGVLSLRWPSTTVYVRSFNKSLPFCPVSFTKNADFWSSCSGRATQCCRKSTPHPSHPGSNPHKKLRCRNLPQTSYLTNQRHHSTPPKQRLRRHARRHPDTTTDPATAKLRPHMPRRYAHRIPLRYLGTTGLPTKLTQSDRKQPISWFSRSTPAHTTTSSRDDSYEYVSPHALSDAKRSDPIRAAVQELWRFLCDFRAIFADHFRLLFSPLTQDHSTRASKNLHTLDKCYSAPSTLCRNEKAFQLAPLFTFLHEKTNSQNTKKRRSDHSRIAQTSSDPLNTRNVSPNKRTTVENRGSPHKNAFRIRKTPEW